MIGVVVLAVVVLVGVVATLVVLPTDRPRTIPRSRAADPDFLPPSRRL